MTNYVWLLYKKNDYSIIWSCVLSLIIHFFLFCILVIKPVFPLVGDSERLDLIWLYTNLEPSGQVLQSNQLVRERVAVAKNAGKSVSKTKVHEAQKTEPEDKIFSSKEHSPEKVDNPSQTVTETKKNSEQVTEMVTAKAGKQKIETPKEEIPVQSHPAAIKTISALKQKSIDTDKAVDDGGRKMIPPGRENMEQLKPESKPFREIVENKNAEIKFTNASSAERKISSTLANTKDVETKSIHLAQSKVIEKKEVNFPPLEKTPNISETKKMGPPASAEKPVDRPRSDEKPDKVSTGMIKAERVERSVSQPVNGPKPEGLERGAETTSENLAAERKKTGTQEKTRQSSVGNNGKTPDNQNSALSKPSDKEPQVKAAAQNPADGKKDGTSEKKKGITLPPLIGDLKLEMIGDTNLVVNVSFKEYLKAHRNRPMTKAESKRIQIVTPITRTIDKTIEVVVGTTGEGVYNFVVKPGSNVSASAVFRLKVYENRSKAKTIPIGTRAVSGKTEIAKILMPEGILWNDDSSFSGYLEDSDSITKYNSETGLVWKEYRDD